MSPNDPRYFRLLGHAIEWDDAVLWAEETTWVPDIILEKNPPTPNEPGQPPLLRRKSPVATVVLSRWQQAAVGKPPRLLTAKQRAAQCRSLSMLAGALAETMLAAVRQQALLNELAAGWESDETPRSTRPPPLESTIPPALGELEAA